MAHVHTGGPQAPPLHGFLENHTHSSPATPTAGLHALGLKMGLPFAPGGSARMAWGFLPSAPLSEHKLGAGRSGWEETSGLGMWGRRWYLVLGNRRTQLRHLKPSLETSLRFSPPFLSLAALSSHPGSRCGLPTGSKGQSRQCRSSWSVHRGGLLMQTSSSPDSVF